VLESDPSAVGADEVGSNCDCAHEEEVGGRSSGL
jgi:hypothetical protein